MVTVQPNTQHVTHCLSILRVFSKCWLLSLMLWITFTPLCTSHDETYQSIELEVSYHPKSDMYNLSSCSSIYTGIYLNGMTAHLVDGSSQSSVRRSCLDSTLVWLVCIVVNYLFRIAHSIDIHLEIKNSKKTFYKIRHFYRRQ